MKYHCEIKSQRGSKKKIVCPNSGIELRLHAEPGKGEEGLPKKAFLRFTVQKGEVILEYVGGDKLTIYANKVVEVSGE